MIQRLYARHGLVIKGGGACPEQYDVFKDDKQVAYYRLRHGDFTVSYPDAGCEEILIDHPHGDGIFYTDERLNYLTKAMRVVIKKISQ
jgi:hypothetical protein